MIAHSDDRFDNQATIMEAFAWLPTNAYKSLLTNLIHMAVTHLTQEAYQPNVTHEEKSHWASAETSLLPCLFNPVDDPLEMISFARCPLEADSIRIGGESPAVHALYMLLRAQPVSEMEIEAQTACSMWWSQDSVSKLARKKTNEVSMTRQQARVGGSGHDAADLHLLQPYASTAVRVVDAAVALYAVIFPQLLPEHRQEVSEYTENEFARRLTSLCVWRSPNCSASRCVLRSKGRQRLETPLKCVPPRTMS
jgi:hypothetical protein